MVLLLLLYIISFLLQIAGTQSQFAFLTPLSLTILLIGSLLFWHRNGHPYRELGFPRDNRPYTRLLIALTIGLLLPILVSGLMILIDIMEIEMGGANGFSARQLLVSVIVMPALIATAEELIFRGVFFQQLRKRANFLGAALTAAALWAALHWPDMIGEGVSPGQLLLGLVTFVSWGCTLSFAYLLAGRSLWAPIGLHFGYNLASSLIGLLFSSTISGNELLSGVGGWVPETGLIGVLLWLLLAFLSGLLVSRTRLLASV